MWKFTFFSHNWIVKFFFTAKIESLINGFGQVVEECTEATKKRSSWRSKSPTPKRRRRRRGREAAEGSVGRKRRRTGSIDDDFDEVEEHEDDDFDSRSIRRRQHYKMVRASNFFDEEAMDDSNDEEEEDEEGQDGDFYFSHFLLVSIMFSHEIKVPIAFFRVCFLRMPLTLQLNWWHKNHCVVVIVVVLNKMILDQDDFVFGYMI